MSNIPIINASAMLGDRTLHMFKRAHILEALDGKFYNLDLNVSSDTEDLLYKAMGEICKTLTLDEPLPCAPLSLWKRFINVGDDTQYRRFGEIPKLPGMYKRKLLLIFRKEHA